VPRSPLTWRFPLISMVVLLALLSPAALASPQGELSNSRATLEKIQQRIRETSKNLAEKRSTEATLIEDLQTVEAELRKIHQRKERLTVRLETLERDIENKNAQLRQVQSSISSLEVQVKKRLVALYKGSDAGFIRILFASVSPARIAEEYDFLGRIVQRDRALLTTYREQVQTLETTTHQLADLRDEQRSSLETLKAEQDTINKAVQLKASLLKQVRSDQKALASQLKELEDKAERLSTLIKKLESEKPREYTEKTGFFAEKKGRLPWPATGKISVGFGTWRHPELGTMYDSQGLEITTGVDKPVVAVAGGKVIFASWFKGYGNLLIVDHGDSYYTLYAQASRLLKKVGDQVSPGDKIAITGYEGKENLYFEVRHGRTPLDPTGWLAPTR